MTAARVPICKTNSGARQKRDGKRPPPRAFQLLEPQAAAKKGGKTEGGIAFQGTRQSTERKIGLKIMENLFLLKNLAKFGALVSFLQKKNA